MVVKRLKPLVVAAFSLAMAFFSNMAFSGGVQDHYPKHETHEKQKYNVQPEENNFSFGWKELVIFQKAEFLILFFLLIVFIFYYILHENVLFLYIPSGKSGTRIR